MTDFAPNDQIQHPAKPEWGTGTVLSVQKANHEGRPCQRLTVRFSGAGKKTLNTGFVRLTRLGTAPGLAENPSPAPRPPTGSKPPVAPPPVPKSSPPIPAAPLPDKATIIDRLATIPQALADPFRPIEDRLTDTASAYRYRPGDRTLLEWAIAQTGLADPLSVLNRHELEEQFTNFRIRLDRHLKSLIDETRRSKIDPRPIIDAAPEPARGELRHALRRINPGR